jgi:hypothetical protein
VGSTAAATAPLWQDGGRRDPLSVGVAQPVYVFDSEKSCSAPSGAEPFDPRWDLIDPARQYPIFSDLPEVLSTNSGRAGRTGAYSAIVEIVHIQTPAGFQCQSVKRADTVKARADSDLRPAMGAQKEYRLLLIIDPGLTAPPVPHQLGWFNQLLVPYIDMGPVPLTADGRKFQTMPVYGITPMAGGTVARRVVVGAADDPADGMTRPAYSPICQDYTLVGDPAAILPDASDPRFASATPVNVTVMLNMMPVQLPVLSACLVCRSVPDGYVCPFAGSRAGAR